MSSFGDDEPQFKARSLLGKIKNSGLAQVPTTPSTLLHSDKAKAVTLVSALHKKRPRSPASHAPPDQGVRATNEELQSSIVAQKQKEDSEDEEDTKPSAAYPPKRGNGNLQTSHDEFDPFAILGLPQKNQPLKPGGTVSQYQPSVVNGFRLTGEGRVNTKGFKVGSLVIYRDPIAATTNKGASLSVPNSASSSTQKKITIVPASTVPQQQQQHADDKAQPTGAAHAVVVGQILLETEYDFRIQLADGTQRTMKRKDAIPPGEVEKATYEAAVRDAQTRNNNAHRRKGL